MGNEKQQKNLNHTILTSTEDLVLQSWPVKKVLATVVQRVDSAIHPDFCVIQLEFSISISVFYALPTKCSFHSVASSCNV